MIYSGIFELSLIHERQHEGSALIKLRGLTEVGKITVLRTTN